MITSAEAYRTILENVSALEAEAVPLAEAADRVLARDIVAAENLPPFDNSAMDGFAARAEDLDGASVTRPIRLPVQETSRAGTTTAQSLKPGHAIRIMTGAPLPSGADAVVIKETTQPAGPDAVMVLDAPERGDHIRRAGEDISAGSMLIGKGRILRPYEIALLAAQGVTEVSAIRIPRVAVVSTGDELVPVGQPLTHGQIRNSNGPAIAAALRRWGMVVSAQRVVVDDASLIEAVIRETLADSDVLLISGGVSVGDFDHTKSVLERIGAEILFWKVAIKPGKPLLFARIKDGNRTRFVFGLPGNPVSSLVCLEEFVRVALETLQGHRPSYPSYHLEGTVENAYPTPIDRRQYVFCCVTNEGGTFRLRVIRPQGSAMMGMACQANALALADVGISMLKAGDRVPFRWLK